jgi:hypothetical protein
LKIPAEGINSNNINRATEAGLKETGQCPPVGHAHFAHPQEQEIMAQFSCPGGGVGAMIHLTVVFINNKFELKQLKRGDLFE